MAAVSVKTATAPVIQNAIGVVETATVSTATVREKHSEKRDGNEPRSVPRLDEAPYNSNGGAQSMAKG
jgi:hypothetical protein